jgi:hypothetical protein
MLSRQGWSETANRPIDSKKLQETKPGEETPWTANFQADASHEAWLAESDLDRSWQAKIRNKGEAEPV